MGQKRGINKAARARRTAARDIDLIAEDLLAASTHPPTPLPGRGPVGSAPTAAATGAAAPASVGSILPAACTDGPSPLSHIPAAATHAPVDVDLPGLGQHYCTACARHFVAAAVLATHVAGRPHRRRVKLLAKGNFYSQAEAERAVGMAPPDNGRRGAGAPML